MELRVRFAETDQMRIAHHAAYVVWLEAARIEWLRSHGLRYRDLEEEGVSLAVSAIALEYRQPARFDDPLRIQVTLSEVRSRRLRFDYRIERLEPSAPPVLLASGHSLHVPTDVSGRALRLPPTWRDALRAMTADLPDSRNP
jgi:acyl-CoA thioester hydrolase